VDQAGDTFPARMNIATGGSSPACCGDQKRPGTGPIQFEWAGGEGWKDHSLCGRSAATVNPYDPKWELYLEARLGWQLGPKTRTGRKSDRIPMEGTKGTMSRSVVKPLRIAEEDCQIHHRNSGAAEGGQDTAGQHGVDACQLP